MTRRPVKSTDFTTLPDGVEIEREDARPYERTAYNVWLNGRNIGRVSSHVEETYRLHGRIRFQTGHAVVWSAYRPDDPVSCGSGYTTRADAIATLIVRGMPRR